MFQPLYLNSPVLGRTVYATVSGRCNVEVHCWSKVWTCDAWLKTSLSGEEKLGGTKKSKKNKLFSNQNHIYYHLAHSWNEHGEYF